MSYLILQDRTTIREKINILFSHRTRHQRRIIFANYLDDIAPKLFPDVYNVNIYCYPQPGNIDPYALEEFLIKGAKIYFTNHINTNLFYVEQEGILLGSANYNFTKLMINNCYENIQDLMVFFNDYSLINIDEIINHMYKRRVDGSDLDDLKEKHHIFWKTYEGLELFPSKLGDIKESYTNISENNNLYQKFITYVKGIKKVLHLNHEDKSLTKNDKIIPIEREIGNKTANLSKVDNNNMNVYCISKNDLLDILTDKFTRQKRKLH